jgi:hypothetical protein
MALVPRLQSEFEHFMTFLSLGFGWRSHVTKMLSLEAADNRTCGKRS